jgi:hypothetical protein
MLTCVIEFYAYRQFRVNSKRHYWALRGINIWDAILEGKVSSVLAQVNRHRREQASTLVQVVENNVSSHRSVRRPQKVA